MLELAIVGDVHGAWDDADAAYFDASGCAAVLFVGDLAGFRWSGTLRVAEAIARMQTRAIVVPGNHDAPLVPQLAAEVAGRPTLGDPLAAAMGRRVDALRQALGPHTLAGYSTHVVGDPSDAVTVVAGRPHSMGGPSLSFPGALRRIHGVRDLAESADRLCAAVDRVETARVVFLAHNGPTGLGDTRDAIWGRDFRNPACDWGDPDLAVAVQHARDRGLRVLAVCAGHMHRRLKGGGRRVDRAEVDGVLYLNAAQVPRLDRRTGTRHHVHLVIDGDHTTAEDRFVEAP